MLQKFDKIEIIEWSLLIISTFKFAITILKPKIIFPDAQKYNYWPF